MRYTGPIFKKARRLKFSVLENNREFSKGKRRTSPPGQHGNSKRKLSDYAVQMQEKQKAQIMYGLNERQLRNTFAKAKKQEGILGLNFLRMLESRLDNLVYRMGLAPTRRASRQLVTHGHVRVNGEKLDIPSAIIKIGSEISIKQKSLKLPLVDQNKDIFSKFVEVNKDARSGVYTRLPERDELNRELNETMIVE
jgi:small subunit ribosomal protein S4